MEACSDLHEMPQADMEIAPSSMPMNPARIALEEQIKCVKREIGMRERVYPHWVKWHRMSQAKADSELQSMRAVLETLSDLEQPERMSVAKFDALIGLIREMSLEMRTRPIKLSEVIANLQRVADEMERVRPLLLSAAESEK